MTQLTGLLELSLAFKQRPCKEFGAGSIGLRFGVGSLAHLLKNRFYIGEITYRGDVRSGEDSLIYADARHAGREQQVQGYLLLWFRVK